MGAASTRSAAVSRARAALAWALAVAVASAFVFYALRDHACPQLCDPEYGRKLHSLRARLAEAPPGRPLVVALGSSRIAMGVRPDSLWAGRQPDEVPAVFFNLGICSAGPVLENVCLHRLLADGVRPDGLVVEVWTPLLTRKYYEETAVLMLDRGVPRYRRGDVSLVARYHPDPVRLRRDWYNRQLLPWSSYRAGVLREVAPSLLPKETRDDATYRHLDGWGFLWIEGLLSHPPAATFDALVEKTRQELALDPFEVSPALDRALRDLLTLARQEGIPVVLLLMPEPDRVSSWYRDDPSGPASEGYVRGLCRDYGAALVNARDWARDEDFFDSAHLTPDGAVLFTRRLEERLLVPFLAGRLAVPAPRPGR
jgi:hypothetical protein